MLADDAAVAAVYGGADGLLAGARPGAVAGRHEHRAAGGDPGVRVRRARSAARASSTRRCRAASTATPRPAQLTIMVGGDGGGPRARPAGARAAGARRIFHLGPLGTGAAMKLAVNTVDLRAQRGAVAEGLVLAERAGIDRAMAYDVLAASAVGAPFVGYKRDRVRRSRTATPVAFSLDLADKDLG